MAEERLEKLPKWAQARIELLERNLREEQARRLAIVPAPDRKSRIVVDDWPGMPGHGFARDTRVDFYVGTEAELMERASASRADGAWISVHTIRERATGSRGFLSINTGGRTLAVVPRSSNLVHVFVRPEGS